MALLEKIRSPRDLKKLSVKELKKLAEEARQKVIEVTSKNGGHVAPNLGAVELTIALHYVYDSPRDKIIWDVGHQAYIHKMLTGRLDRIHTLRTYKGLSGFTSRAESEHDPFGAGHASTAISAALGFATARDLLGEDYHVVAVVGDGALTGGMAMEALNYGGHVRRRITIVLNDNERSIAENVGGISNYLAKLSSNKLYNRIKQDINELLQHIPDNLLTRKAKTVAWKVKESLKNLMVPTILFEELGYRYIGPVNGHDIEQLIDIFMHVRDFVREPVVVHVITKKGKGYEPAERNPELFHGLGPYDPKTGEPIKKPGPPSYSSVAGKTILEIAEKDPKVVAITAAMALGTGLVPFRERFPELFVVAGARTTSKLRILAGDEHTSKQQVIRIDRDPTVDPPNPFEEEMIRALRDEELEGVLASDYGYGLLTPRLVAELRELARRVPVVVDSHHRLAEFRGVTAITPNEAEASLASGVPIRSEADLREAGRRLLRRVAPRAVLITRGNRGMALFRPRRPPRLIPVHGPAEALDVTGAGDTVAAAFLLALASGASFEEAAELSNLAASVVVMKRGTATVSQAELMGLVDG